MFYAWEKYEVSQDNRPAKLRMLTIDNTILQTGRLSLLARCLLCQLSRLGLTHEIAQGETHETQYTQQRDHHQNAAKRDIIDGRSAPVLPG